MKALSTRVWEKLTSKTYRDQFIFSQFNRFIPLQITSIRKKAGWSQEDLATASGLTQGVISRAEDPNYGNLTVNTILRIAAGFKMGFKGEFVPLSELVEWTENLTEESVRWVPLEQDNLTIVPATGALGIMGENPVMVQDSLDAALKESPPDPSDELLQSFRLGTREHQQNRRDLLLDNLRRPQKKAA